jgi:hypothetical protein
MSEQILEGQMSRDMESTSYDGLHFLQQNKKGSTIYNDRKGSPGFKGNGRSDYFEICCFDY